MPRAVIVVNPISGSPRRRDRVRRFAEALERDGVATEIHPTRGPEDGAVRAREAAESGVEIVVAAGGDGTVNDVAAGLVGAPESAASLAILPLGTANLVARHFDISLNSPDDAARGLAASSPLEVDIAECNDRLMIACAGVGLDAQIVEEVSRARSGHIGKLTYLRPTLRTVRTYPWTTVRVTVDDHEPVEGHVLLILNVRPYAAVLEPVPGASAMDGLLDVVLLRGKGLVRMARWMARAAVGRLLEDSAATHLRGSRVRVEAEPSVPLEIDGDAAGRSPAEFVARPGALRIVLPTARGPVRAY